MKRLFIIGAGGHGRVAADIAVKNGYEEILFLDDDETVKACGRYPVIGKREILRETKGDIFVAIGNPATRKVIQESIVDERLTILIHPNAVVGEDVVIEKGTIIMAGTVINPGSRIGKGCIINTCASVDHDCRLGEYVHVAVGAHITGQVEIGNKTWIGAGAIVSNHLRICGSCIIGAGAVVVKDIEEAGTYVGIPAKLVKYHINGPGEFGQKGNWTE